MFRTSKSPYKLLIPVAILQELGHLVSRLGALIPFLFDMVIAFKISSCLVGGYHAAKLSLRSICQQYLIAGYSRTSWTKYGSIIRYAEKKAWYVLYEKLFDCFFGSSYLPGSLSLSILSWFFWFRGGCCRARRWIRSSHTLLCNIPLWRRSLLDHVFVTIILQHGPQSKLQGLGIGVQGGFTIISLRHRQTDSNLKKVQPTHHPFHPCLTLEGFGWSFI